ncbi:MULTISPECIES: mandelate racemase/muconate lactonizing enzyme family protein [unclassified Haladaptatus]|uniref:mandelate racemase/muconate lactonizing enzyme family protein n=1 Tax=unclassified Haladaptatus TaxID=2622732 RepID=UPI00209BC64B|nr:MULTISPECIES: mandelate racemase/muconate lactonizing enzyme family protein [unclassified Haladaptatus]MCO8244821.1 mandelate racemase/muconate lactonizing enzyme family protein [Haladaptatus sp. AB643]MCO8255667.1 mandelate racemase/muconate lactonizing enzyme family protein [Haladaptatus sp. AB618]
MRLTNVSGYALSSPIDPPQDRRFSGGVRRLRKRDVVLVVLETETGERGVATAGASSSAMREYFEGDSQATFADVVNGAVSESLVGESIEAVTDAHELLHETGLPDRLRYEAISAIDVALYDLRGKELGAPIYELLAEEFGSDPTTEIPMYASAGMYMDPAGYAEQARALEASGFMGYKYRPGIGVDGDRETIDRLAETVDDMEFMLDTHTWWKLRDAYGEAAVSELVEYASERGAYWIEEPVEPDDRAGYIELSATGAPLAGGESEETSAGLIELGRTEAVDFLQGDVRHHEGYTGCVSAVEFCRGRDVEFVPHNFGTWLGLVANAHLVAAAPEVDLLEYPVFERDPLLGGDVDPGMYPFDLAFDIITGTPSVTDGVLTVPDGPGLGVEVDLDVIEEYPFIDGPWTEFRYDEDL